MTTIFKKCGLGVEIAEAKRMPRYKAQSKSLKRRKQRQYAPCSSQEWQVSRANDTLNYLQLANVLIS